jgi:hypothetical protein
MKAIILTDDTKSQLPKHRSWSKKFGRGSGIVKDPSVNHLLQKENFTVPTNDLENEEKYKQILFEFIRPAKNMFAGRFTEIRSFEDKLKDVIEVEILIVSGRYGLINGDMEIIPYDYSIDKKVNLKDFDEKYKFLSKLKAQLPGSTHLIILLPKIFIKYFMKQGFFEELPYGLKIIIVSSKEFEEPLKKYQNIILLERRGVSRLRNQDSDRILSLVQISTLISEKN